MCQTGSQTVAAGVVAVLLGVVVLVVAITCSVGFFVAEGVVASSFAVAETAFAEPVFQNFVWCAQYHWHLIW